MITQRARYALKAMLYLAEQEEGRLVQANEIADQQHVPLKFLEQVLADLRQASLVASQRGRYGGYRLAAPAHAISLLSILRATDGPVAPLTCLSRTAYKRCSDCDDEAGCGVRLMMQGVYEASLQYMATHMLADGVRQQGGKADGTRDGNGTVPVDA